MNIDQGLAIIQRLIDNKSVSNTHNQPWLNVGVPRIYKYYNEDEPRNEQYKDILDAIDDQIDVCTRTIVRCQREQLSRLKDGRDLTWIHYDINRLKSCVSHWESIRSKLLEDDGEYYIFSHETSDPTYAEIHKITVVKGMSPYRITLIDGEYKFDLSRTETYDGVCITSMLTEKYREIFAGELTNSHKRLFDSFSMGDVILEDAYYTDKAVNRSLDDINDMTFIKCKKCGRIFGISSSEKQWYIHKGFCLPKSCVSCRSHKQS